MRATRASLLARAGSAAAVAILAGGGVMATATAASAAAGHPKPKLDATNLSIKNKPIAHSKHHASSITGVLRDGHTGVAGETITLEGRIGKGKWVADPTTMTTGTDGSVAFTVTPTAKTQYKLVFGGDTTAGLRKSHSNVITLKVAKA